MAAVAQKEVDSVAGAALICSQVMPDSITDGIE